ncbi:MAG: acyl-CoA dehydrogenase [Kofleriaceae bacterium]|nr:acyl-CoA dehydrogenase [Kofleriaceae bacterium]
MSENILFSDRDVEFLLYEVLGLDKLCQYPGFSEHSRESFDMLLSGTRRFARQKLLASHSIIDQDPPYLKNGKVIVPALMTEMVKAIIDMDFIAASRPESVGGIDLPISVYTMATCYLMAANCSASGYTGLTLGAAHLIEKFGTEELRERYMKPMYEGRWLGTMALTEPHAGSSLGDIRTSAKLQDAGHYLIAGSKIFISGGDHDICENIVHMVLGRIDGAPEGSAGVSLFVVPKLRMDEGALVDNDVSVAGLIHKIGWKGMPSLAMNYGDEGACHGYLIGPAGRGLYCMFQMMNEARIMVGANGVSTAAVAYQESLNYAKERPQGRALGSKGGPQINIVEHADVRRMLLRQKAIVEGGLSVVIATAKYSDIAAKSEDEGERAHAQLLLDLLTPIAKSFPAEKGYESNTLALQIHGGYGYSSEYKPECWLREQKLNSIHEGTTGIQSLDLLGRKVMSQGGTAMMALAEIVQGAIKRSAACGHTSWATELGQAMQTVGKTTQALGVLGMSGDPAAMLRHSVDYLDMFSTLTVAWQLLERASVAKEALDGGSDEKAFYEGKIHTAEYWFASEVPRISLLAAICQKNDSSYTSMDVESF